jgi:alkanesulfonate monooxygenase SsuD/methylene tetrahydromethanopterin reductase-like flavin-dependent oxidoreductase (luciferase family)
VLAAAAQRTIRIELGTAVIPLGWENPLRLAEDLATVDILAGGRLHPGVSVGPPMHFDQVKQALYPDTADAEDFSYERVRRLLALIRGEAVTDAAVARASRSSRTGSSRRPRAWAPACGTAAPACARRGGRASTG